MAVRIATREHINGWLFVGPALILLGIFMIFPIGWSLWMTAQTGRGLNFAFGGFANIQRLLGDTVFLRALGNTMIFLVVQVPIMIILALLFAVALNDTKLWGRSFFRTAIFLPCVTSLVAYAVLFKAMSESFGDTGSRRTADLRFRIDGAFKAKRVEDIVINALGEFPKFFERQFL